MILIFACIRIISISFSLMIILIVFVVPNSYLMGIWDLDFSLFYQFYHFVLPFNVVLLL